MLAERLRVPRMQSRARFQESNPRRSTFLVSLMTLGALTGHFLCERRNSIGRQFLLGYD
jgi:hypothetical protein